MVSGKISLEVHGKVAVLTADCGQNRFNPDFINNFNKALDEVESNPNVQALVTTGVGKFYSNGLDVNWMAKSQQPELLQFFQEVQALDIRMLTFPVPTIAALNGHGVAQGALFAMRHDYRVMRTKIGWFSMPEVHLKLPLGEHNAKLVRSKVSGAVARDALVLGKWYSPEESLKAGLVDQLAEPEELLDSAIKLAHQCIGARGFDRVTMKSMKENVYKDILEIGTVEVDSTKLSNYQKLAKL